MHSSARVFGLLAPVALCFATFLQSNEASALPPGTHPAIEQWFDNADRALTKEELKQLSTIDVSNTARGSNVALLAAVSSYAVHEIVPLVLSRCGAPASATKAKALPAIQASNLERAQEVLEEISEGLSEEMKKTPRPQDLAYACSNAAPDVLSATGDLLAEVHEALGYKKQGINQAPDYGRQAGGGSMWVLRALGEARVPRTVVMTYAEGFLRLMVTTSRGAAPTPPAGAKAKK